MARSLVTDGIMDSTGFLTRRPIAATNPVRLAYCKVAAGASTSIVCYLDTDTTGLEITVECTIIPAANLNAALPLLAIGSELKVTKINGTWKCVPHFWKADICT
ncbi:hypothetical protein LCGC14_1636750, partial [marine sediment metagenome]